MCCCVSKRYVVTQCSHMALIRCSTSPFPVWRPVPDSWLSAYGALGKRAQAHLLAAEMGKLMYRILNKPQQLGGHAESQRRDRIGHPLEGTGKSHPCLVCQHE